MKDSAGRKGARQDVHRNKKPTGWPDYFDWMVRYARRRVPEGAAHEVANDALFDAYRSDKPKPRIDDVSEVRRWLSCFIIWRASRHHRREQNVRLWDSYDFNSHEELDEFGTTMHSDEIIDRLELAKILDELSLEERTLLWAYHANGFTASELAAQKGVSEKSIRKQVEKAKASFVKVYARRQRTEAGGLLLAPWSDNETFRRLLAHWRSICNFMMPAIRLAVIGATCIAVVVVPSDVAGSPAMLAKTSTNVSLPTGHEPKMQIGEEKSIELEKNKQMVEIFAPTAERNEPPIEMAKRHLKPSAVIETGAVDRADGKDGLEKEDVKASPLTEVAPIQPESKRSASECINAFAEATTAFRFLDDPQSCLAYLNMVPSDGTPCPESAPRMALRALCEAGLAKK